LRKYFILAHDTARANAKAAIADSPDGYAVEIKPITRSLAQNAKLHALITDIAKTLEWAGAKRDVETWKRLLTAAWLRARGEPIEMLPALDGHGVDIVFRRTSELTVNEMIELIEYIQSWAVANGIDV
jgi:hypothetical protein